MIVQRLSVEGGFLDGLDLVLNPNLNVLIGERGTGKSSVVELMRYVLGGVSLNDGVRAAREERARSLLGDGAVHAELMTSNGIVTISRTHRDGAPRTSIPLAPWTVVGQGEMEAIGIEPASRLRLLDRYGEGEVEDERTRASAASSSVRSLTEQLTEVRRDLIRVDGELEQLESIPQQLTAAMEEQKEGLQSAEATEEDSEALSRLQVSMGGLRQLLSQLNESIAIAQSNRDSVRHSVAHWRPFEIPSLSGDAEAIAIEAQQRSDAALRALNSATSDTDVAIERLADLKRILEDDLAEIDEGAKDLRGRLEKLRTGLSAAARKVEGLREKEGTRTALLERRKQLTLEAEALARSRRDQYSELDRLREKRRQRRSEVATSLHEHFAPEIRVTVHGGADRSAFIANIVTSLTGSGLHYNTLAPLLATALTPLELVEASEQLNDELIANSAGIPESRAAQVALQLTTQGLASIAASPIEDVVTIELLDGASYKGMKELSIGQRCTVVLPVVLGAPTSGLILDQPEDHLDNAFLASRIVPAIKSRAQSTQVLIATHNPNIPVLGDAELVVHMGSDGARGFVEHSGGLEEEETRRAITEIMEGGEEAFARRAEFYGHRT